MERFLRGVAASAVASICLEVGVERSRDAVVDVLVDVLQRYIETLGLRAGEFTELAGRTQGNLHDMLQAMDAMGVDMGKIRSLAAATAEGQGACDVPPLPMRKRRRGAPEMPHADGDPLPPEVPAFLGPMPPSHTLRGAGAASARRRQAAGAGAGGGGAAEAGPADDDEAKRTAARERKLAQRRAVQQSLSRLQSTGLLDVGEGAAPGAGAGAAAENGGEAGLFKAPAHGVQPAKAAQPSAAGRTNSGRATSKEDRIIEGTFSVADPGTAGGRGGD